MQKTGIIVLGSVTAMLPALAQASETVRLAEPDLAMEGSLMTALKNRHSTREYAAKDLTGADLSNLLWATAEELGSTILFHRMTAIDNLINKLSHLPFRIRRNQLFVQILITQFTNRTFTGIEVDGIPRILHMCLF